MISNKFGKKKSCGISQSGQTMRSISLARKRNSHQRDLSKINSARAHLPDLASRHQETLKTFYDLLNKVVEKCVLLV